MQTAKAIKQRLIKHQQEIDRINELIMSGKFELNDVFHFSNGKPFEVEEEDKERGIIAPTFDEILSSEISSRNSLKWVLGIKS